MKLNTLKRTPMLIAAGVIGLVCLAQIRRPELVERLERMTYDWRAREGVKHSPLVATNLGFVSISDESIAAVQRGVVRNTHYGLKWPRHIYGRVAWELANQGARAVAFDILFSELRPDHSSILMERQAEPIESDDLFALQIKKAGNVIIAAEDRVVPPTLFRKSALALGDITADRDFDGILRRAMAFRSYRKWHTAFRQIGDDPDYGVDLDKAGIETNQIVLPRAGEKPIVIPLDKDGNFDIADFVGDKIPAGMARHAKPFTTERIWHMGIVLAAQGLGLDLTNPQVELSKGRITLRGTNGVKRIIPVDRDGYFYINWCLKTGGNELTQEPFEEVLAQYEARQPGKTNELVETYSHRGDRRKIDWHNKLVVVGSSAVGNDLTDRGATPLAEDTLLVSKHWNVANSILTGQFIRRSSLPVELLLIIIMGASAAYVTWVFRSNLYFASGCVALTAIVYVTLATLIYVQFRYWMPVVFPVVAGGGPYVALLVYIVVFEQKERRKLRSIFTKVLSPDVVTELEAMQTEKLALSGARRNVTVLFADIRGFTEMTDMGREKAEEYILENHLTGEAAEAVRDAQARDTLDTVNKYLTIVAEAVLKHKGTVDKFIGDCVMAFWGAPLANPKHALTCVRAAIEAQRSIHKLNLEREAENQQRESENLKLAAEGKPILSLLPTLVLGSGINTGVVTVGLMGSEQMLNYTVFGRDVNLASRLESVSGRGRIIISEATLAEMIQDDPALALSCRELPPEKVKGFRVPVKIYEVPWKEEESSVSGGETTQIFSAEDNTGYFSAKDPGVK